MNQKKIKKGIMSFAFLVVVVAIVILINMISTTLTDRYALKLDLTAGGLYSITEETTQMLKKLENPITITVLSDEAEFKNEKLYQILSQILDKYAAAGGSKVSIQYIDPYKNPSIVNRYNENQEVQAGYIVVECAEQFKVLSPIEFYNTTSDQSGVYATGLRAEQTLTTAILSVTNEDIPKAYILIGHNEAVSTSLRDMLTGASFAVETLSLMEKDIPEDTDLLIISMPQTDYMEDELNKLDAYLKSGGSVIFFGGTSTPSLPNLEAYIGEWGVRIENQMVLDSEHAISHPLQVVAQLDSTSEVNTDLMGKSGSPLIVPEAKPITIVSGSLEHKNTTPVLATYDSAYAKKLDDLTENDTFEKASKDVSGPFTLAALCQYTGSEKTGRFLVVGSAMIQADDLIAASSYLNHSFLSTAVSVLTPDAETISIPSKSLSAEPLTIMGQEVTIVFWIVIVLIPLLILAAGIAIFVRRRHQ